MEITPEQLAIRRRELATDYNSKMKELGDIRKRKAFKIIELLGEHKTANKAEMYWAITEDGQKETELTMYCRGLIELMRAAKTEIDIKHAESFGQY